MSFLLKLIYIFTAIPLKITVGFFVETVKLTWKDLKKPTQFLKEKQS